MKRFSFIILVLFSSLQILFAQGDGTIFPDTYGEELIQKLQQAYKPAYVLNYDDARDTMFAVIDNHNGQVTCVYSGYIITLDPNKDPSSDAYDKDMNTEHTWPQSMGADQGNARSDLHHLFPCRVQVNSSRGNDPYAEIDDNDTDTWWRLDYSQSTIPTSYIDEYSEKDNTGYFEPREDHKGNAARAVFYFYTMYRDQADSNFFKQQKEVLRQWNLIDAVDQAERDRSALVAQYQDGKENPFILDTTLVRRAYFYDGNSSGSGNTQVDNPSDFIATATSNTEITLSWTRNSDLDDVMIVWNTNGSFQSPEDSVTYSDGQEALGGTIISRRADTVYVHSELTTGTTYYYRAFSVHGAPGEERYSSGTDDHATPSESGSGQAQPGDVIITEIMQNPSAVYDSDGEWLELYNTTDSDIDINNWYLKDDDSDSHQINNNGPLIIPAHDWLVLGINKNSSTNGSVEVDYQYSNFLLGNGADEVVLLLSDGVTEIDRIEYDGGSQWPDPTGASMYFTWPYNKENNDGSQWETSQSAWAGSSGDKGSPGYSDQVSSLQGSTIKPQDFELLAVFPNPLHQVNPLKVTVFNPQSHMVYVELFSMLGQRVGELFHGFLGQGRREVSCTLPLSLASGIYWLRVRDARNVLYRKIVVLH